jgi:hypothetical protein
MQQRLRQAAIDNANLFEVLMDAVRLCSVGRSPSSDRHSASRLSLVVVRR